MWRSMEEVMRELKEEGIILEDEDDDDEQHYFNKTQGGGGAGGGSGGGGLPPGFRFHPTDEELITCYLASKVFTSTTTTTTTTTTNNNNNNGANLLLSSGVQIAEVDLTRCEPWDLPERAKMGEREWYLYSLRDRKYPSGLRTNRATETGYWKATGKDRQVYASSITTTPPATAGGGGGGVLIGMKKTLVFYQGRAPRGLKTKWVMHEYRLDGHFSSFRLSSKEEWVICRIFHKNNNGDKKNQAIIIEHPSHSPLPLSPFLSTLPPLQQQPKPKPNTIITQKVAHNNNNNNSLLQSLLSNPLPNFSSISGSHPIIFPPPTTTADLPWWLSTTNTTTTATAAAAATKQQNWLDRIICPQEQIQQYFENQYHDQAMIHDQTVDIHPLPNNNNNNDDTAAAVHVDVAAAGALDRMLLNHSSYHPAVESWSLFHYP